MRLRIKHSSERPVYQQIVDCVKRYIAHGRLVKGQRLTPTRELAEQLEVDPNTTAKAYRQLEREGVIVTKGGAGTFVGNLQSRLREEVKRVKIRQK
jgi:GntR family transcriptional regulator